MKVKVYPTKASALNVTHPIDGRLVAAGSQWEDDGFTARMLSDGIVTLTPPVSPAPAKGKTLAQ